MSLARPLWFVLGILALAAGLVGAVLPLVPTTVFLILAAYAFARSSDRLHRWLVEHPRFGPPIRDWREHGAIGRRQKVLAVALMAAAFALSLALGVPAGVLLVQAVVLLAAGVFVLTRPGAPDGG